MATTKLAVVGFLAGDGTGRRGLLTSALSAVLLCGCSVYDPSLLPARGTGDIRSRDGGDDKADAGGDDAAVEECMGSTGRCERPHADAKCSDAGCVIARCLDGYVDCDGESANGCEAKLDTAQNCGLCGAACRYNNATASCNAGRCGLAACKPGFGNCDGDDDNGCETDLNTIWHCGECGKECGATQNATPGCKDLKCGVGVCTGSFGDCDGKPENGCEQSLNTPEHCGTCGDKCDPAHGEGSCASGSCVISKCDPGFADCNGRAADGCETALDGSDNCGGCGRTCKLAHTTQAVCAEADDNLRCEVTHACDPEATPCTQGDLKNGCEKGFADCDKDPANGCEADLSRATNCGGCGVSCSKPNTVSECREGKCVDTGCAPGSDKCGGNECKSLASDPKNCGMCGRTCGDGMMCAGGRCTSQMCSPGQADCDSEANNGCEISLSDNANCGACGLRCPDRMHAQGICRNGACGIRGCEQGWKDCDDDPSNGCEVDIRTLNDCGDCQRACIASNAETTCNNGQCQITRCSEGRGNCNDSVADGCEADFGLPATCGGCNNVCAARMDVVSASCDEGKCNLVCGSGRADCDGMTANGCEADLSNPASCGSCKNNCTMLPNVASATCDAGVCGKIVCRPGFGDCNGDPSDGCERSLNSASDCGACGRACALAHAEGQCTNGNCAVSRCDTGFADCNNRPADGCEAALSSPQNCGACGTVCPNDASCTNGHCGCTTDAECGAGNSCCNGVCSDTSTTCFLWPCLPGTEVPSARENCGGCGMVCLLWCCQG